MYCDKHDEPHSLGFDGEMTCPWCDFEDSFGYDIDDLGESPLCNECEKPVQFGGLCWRCQMEDDTR